ncbi:Clr5 domain-containing protein, partial [Lasiosphaeris hirsuta]
DRPLVPTSAADWEAKKDVINELYMARNLILNDVMAIMLSKHNFKATARMYKGQFAKWGWSKYNKSGNAATATRTTKSRTAVGRRRASNPPSPEHDRVSKPVASSHRPRPSFTPNLLQLLFVKDETYEIEAVLSTYGDYISSWATLETPWKAESSVPGIMARQEQFSILQNMRTALDHFDRQQPQQGGRMLRLAFLQVEEALVTGGGFEAIWDCCLAIPQLVLAQGWLDILLIFTRYLYHLTTLKLTSGHPVARIAQAIFRLARRDPAQLQMYIAGGWRLWIDLVRRHRGAEDMVAIHLKRGYVILQRPEPNVVRSLLPDFALSVEHSLATRGAIETTSRVLEMEMLLARMYIPLFTPDTTVRAEAMLKSLLERVSTKPENRDLPVHQWTYIDRYLFFSAYHFMASIADYSGDHNRAVNYRRKSLESPKDLFWLQTAMTLEQYLRSEGRIEEAAEIERER